MNIKECLKKGYVILDGGMGTLLQREGLAPGELPERWNLTHPDVIKRIHRDYFDSGSNIVNANTFGANSLKFSPSELEGIISSAIKNAKEAMGESSGRQEKWVALDIGPTGRMLEPLGDLSFEEAVEIFAQTVRLGVKHGADLVFIETMSDSYETKAALLAAKENSSLPVLVSCAYGKDGKLMTGASPLAMISMLEGMGADAIGVNCSLGPKAMAFVLDEYKKYSSLPIIFKPNAGLPRTEKGRTVYDLSAGDFADQVISMTDKGVRAIGGCCGTTPEYVAALAERVKKVIPEEIEKKTETLVSSYTHAVSLEGKLTVIGERINPTGKPRFREAIRSGDMDIVLKEAIGQQDAGADVLDVNLGIPGIDEPHALCEAVCRIQEICDLPLQIDSADPCAMEVALRRYNGKAMINSVNGKRESLDAVLPLAKKYGGVVVALTLDENGIPKTADERLVIAKRIFSEAKKYGIDKKNLIFDPLAMAVSADKDAAKETLLALRLIRDELGCSTSLGISNISFGLPGREYLNSAFLDMAIGEGLSAAIMNPYANHTEVIPEAKRALLGEDENFGGYISFIDGTTPTDGFTLKLQDLDLKQAIIKGLKAEAAALTKKALLEEQPLDIVNNEIIPALDRVGEGYESKKIYLPSLLMSAEAAGAAFECIKSAMPRGETDTKCRIILATVKGDIHDIGKNIVKLLLENYGFAVADLGKDVSPDKIAEEVVRLDAKILGLSALMTTTLPAMAETVQLVRGRAPMCKIMVGGAVLTEEYAKEIGVDFYGKDALSAVKFAESVNKS